MSKKVAVILAGCGVYDGSEIYETVLTLLSLEKAGAEVTCFAPNIPQMHVVNHLTGEVSEGEQRQVLVESARIVRGAVHNLDDAKVDSFDALIVPGGFGVAKNLSDFAVNGSAMTVNETLLSLVKGFKAAAKPVGLMCIAPTLAATIFGPGVKCTIGNDTGTAAAVVDMGAEHVESDVTSVVIDQDHKLVTTPAYMLANSISDAATGIEKLVNEVVALA